MYQIWKLYVNEKIFFIYIYNYFFVILRHDKNWYQNVERIGIIKNIIYNRKFLYQIFTWLYLANEVFQKCGRLI